MRSGGRHQFTRLFIQVACQGLEPERNALPAYVYSVAQRADESRTKYWLVAGVGVHVLAFWGITLWRGRHEANQDQRFTDGLRSRRITEIEIWQSPSPVNMPIASMRLVPTPESIQQPPSNHRSAREARLETGNATEWKVERGRKLSRNGDGRCEEDPESSVYVEQRVFETSLDPTDILGCLPAQPARRALGRPLDLFMPDAEKASWTATGAR